MAVEPVSGTFKVKVVIPPPGVTPLTYANQALIQVSESDVTVTFLQVPMPYAPQKELEKLESIEGYLVGRFALPHHVAIRLAQTLQEALTAATVPQKKNKKKGKK